MNVRTDLPVVLVISSAEVSDTFREALAGVLVDYPVVAIHEMDDSTHWAVSFGETAWNENSFDFELQRGRRDCDAPARRSPPSAPRRRDRATHRVIVLCSSLSGVRDRRIADRGPRIADRGSPVRMQTETRVA